MIPATNEDPALQGSQLWSQPERWLAAIIESSDAAIMGETLDGRIMSWNASASRVFGYTAEEAIGMPVFSLAWPGEEGSISGLLEAMRRGERIDNFETSRKHKDGHRVFISLNLYPIKDSTDTVVGIAKIATDITGRIVAEERDARTQAELLAERKYRELIEHAPDAIVEVDASGLIVIANKTAEVLFRFSPGELVGTSIDLLVPDAQRGAHASHRGTFAHAGQARPMGYGLDLNARRKDGSEFPVEISLSPIFTDNGVLVVAAIRDVTERRKSAQQLQLLQEGYLTEIAARQEEAERLNRLKSEFVASVSHELRTPLHTIIGFADLLSEDPEQTLSAKQSRFVENIQRDSEHLLELINDVLDLSRIEAGGLAVHAEELSLPHLITEVVQVLKLASEAKSLRVNVDCDPELKLQADPTRIRQILSNLISNAIKFTDRGGSIDVRVTAAEGFVSVTVRDSGIGIAEEEQANIFGKFYQVGVTTGGVREGTGLGLAICKQLVELHGGELRVVSQPGLGSMFSFTIPSTQQ